MKSGVVKFPNIQLDEDKIWELSVIKFIGVLDRPLKMDGIYRMRTNMIDRDETNSLQEISYHVLEHDSTYIDIQPTRPIRYKLRFHDFSTAELKFQEINLSNNLIFTSVALQLEITDSYGRI